MPLSAAPHLRRIKERPYERTLQAGIYWFHLVKTIFSEPSVPSEKGHCGRLTLTPEEEWTGGKSVTDSNTFRTWRDGS